MYAVVQIGGHQYRVAEGDLLFVDRRQQDEGESFSIDDVLMLNDEGTVEIGAPVIEGASVEATLVDQVKADKVIVFKKKRRKGYKKKNGHRQPMSQIKIDSITASDKKDKTEKSATSEKKEQNKETDGGEQQLSTDMTAKEAIAHIKNSSVDELAGFVPEDETRVTVQRAWESKQEE